MNEYYVYIYLDPRKPVNFSYNNEIKFLYEPFYVGKGKNSRCYYHLLKAVKDKKTKHPFYSKLNKLNNIGKKPIILKVKKHLQEQEALKLEKELIQYLNSKCSLTNLTEGGVGGDTWSFQSPERKEEIRFKRSQSMLGKNKRPRTQEEKENLSRKNKGKVLSKKTREKISKALKGRKRFPESFEKGWETRRKNGNASNPCLKKTREKISKALKGRKQQKVICPHCNKEGRGNTMQRWHFDKCKERKDEI